MEIKQYGYTKLPSLEIEMQLEVDTIEQAGLYFICQPSFSSNEDEYIVKVGKAINLHSRMLQYKSMNPLGMHYSCNSLIIPQDTLRIAEIRCHNFLAKFAIGVLDGTNEWFIFKNDKKLEQIFEIFDNRKPYWKQIVEGE